MPSSGKGTRFAVIGLSHPHGEDMVEALVGAGAELAAYFEKDDDLAAEFGGDSSRVRRARSMDEILLDETLALVVSAAVPRDRPGIAVAAMDHGKDVLLDKPACTSQSQLDELRRAHDRTGRHLAVWFDERLGNPASLKAAELIGEGAIGEIVHVIGTGPHDVDTFTRPDWFYEPDDAGGILVDLGCQQIDIFIALTGARAVAVEAARVGNVAHPEKARFQDIGDVLLRDPSGAMGYLRVDWLTPAGLGAYGDGRTLIVGTEGTLELRRDIDPAGRGEGHHIFLTDREGTRYVPADDVELPFALMMLEDLDRLTEAAMTTEHALRVTELSLDAQALAYEQGEARSAQVTR